MRLTLFTVNKAFEYFLPKQVSGSYSFGEEVGEEQKILNIEAIDNNWTIYAKDGLSILHDNQYLTELNLCENEFYVFQKEQNTYFLLTSPLYEEGTKIYMYDQNINLHIGSTNDANVYYPNPYIDGIPAQIKMVNGQLILYNAKDSVIYLNNERVTEEQNVMKIGDTLNVLGLRIMFLDHVFMINNPYKGITLNTASAYIQEFNYTTEKYENIEVKDIDLYNKDSYFSKSPRIRRIIEEKEIKIDKPPNNNQEEELPVLLTAGPMISMGAMSGMTLINTITRVTSGQATMADSWPSIVTGCLMLTTSILWPFLTKAYNKHAKRDKRRRTIQVYSNYLDMKEADLKKELILQKNILDENLIKSIDCLKIINTRKNNFWCKRIEQSDFLSARIGIGNIPLKVKVNWPEEGFEIEQDDLKVMAENLIEKYKYIENSPLEYSFYENFLTAMMGIEKKCYGLAHNVLLQFMTFYCYDELKIIVFTSDQKARKWDYLKYSNYCFNTEKNVRFFATNVEEAKELSSYLMQELNFRIQITEGGTKPLNSIKPYYLIICDNYSMYKKIDFFKVLLEMDNNIGYSTIIIENKLDKLPSKCINFINLNEGSSGVLKNSYEKAEITNFHDEIDYSINMMSITKILANIPIEVETAGGKLPEAIEFLEMEKVGKVEQLNILNRWKMNDSTKSLKAEVGVDEENNLMYLDLHEKFHGPHGLVAGTTGSGKSEFIITYILSMSMNYSPDDVAFILIDYKGGGLAFAFENKLTGVKLPHLAGTITNLDKSEMNRTLVSIDSEVKRRQAEFNKARDMLGESTIDIYKYQRFYHEGKLKEPIPHLFIISDEFAELKSQQPEFMDNLISVARIGRSLGVHLILATQKPSGVVNDQIWSNTKFRVCLKVADASDSNEMLKKPDAALLKQSGRFYLQVGTDEIYALGQSGWAGAKYYPSDKIHTKVDKSIDFIDNMGQIIKTIQESNGQAQKEAQGEQLASVVAWVAGGTAFAMDAGLDKLGKAAKGATTLKEVGKYTLAGAGMGIVEPTVNYTTQYLTYANDQVDENGNPLYDNYLDYMATSGYLFEAGVGSLIGAGSTGSKAFKSYNINTEITNRAASHGSGNIPLDLGYRTTKKYTIGNPPFEIKTDLTEGEMIKFANDFYNLKPPISSLDEIPAFGVPNRAADIEVSPDGTYGVNWVDEQGFKIGKDGKPIKTEGTIPAGQQMDRYGNPNGRFAGEMEIDSNGNYQGVKYGERSLPYAEGSQAYSKFEVTKDINSQNLSTEINARPEAERIAIIKSMESDGLKNGVDFTVDSNNNVTVHVFEGEIAPAYGYKGGGTQYEFPVRTKILEDLGFIKPIK